MIDQSVTEYAVINRRDMHSLSDPNQSPSENVIILVYQNLCLCLIKCICKATIQLRSLEFRMPTLWVFRCNIFGTSSASFLEFWLSKIGTNLAVSNRQIRLANIKIADDVFAEIMYKYRLRVFGKEVNTT